jgi:curved DNA-binding protein CbpA
MPFRPDPTKEYYAILGLKEDASSEEIRKSYRRLALHYHPDRNRGNPGAEDRFKAISEAYGVLIDQEKRRAFDQSRQTGQGAPGREQAPWDYSSQEDILRDLLRDREAAEVFRELTREFQRMGFQFDDGFVRHMFFGGRAIFVGGIFSFGGPFSRGRGAEAGSGWRGRGRIEPWGPWRQADGASGGSSVGTGEGRSPGLVGLLVRGLRGVASGIGRVARLALGTGARGGDLQHELLVTPEEARAGTKKPVQFVRGNSLEEVVVTIPSGVRSGTRLRLRGKGLVGKNGEPGDLYLEIRVSG